MCTSSKDTVVYLARCMLTEWNLLKASGKLNCTVGWGERWEEIKDRGGYARVYEDTSDL